MVLILQVHCNSFRQKLLHSHSVELIGLVILCGFFPLDCCLCSPRLDLVFCCCYFPSLLYWLRTGHLSYIQYSRRAIDYYIYFIDENKRYSRKFRWTMFSVFLCANVYLATSLRTYVFDLFSSKFRIAKIHGLPFWSYQVVS
jgi:hypothetical protein